MPPGVEHRPCQEIALLLAVLREIQQRTAGEPAHGEETASGKLVNNRGNADFPVRRKSLPVHGDMRGLPHIVQFLADAGADFLGDLPRVDGRAHPPVQREQHL